MLRNVQRLAVQRAAVLTSTAQRGSVQKLLANPAAVRTFAAAAAAASGASADKYVMFDESKTKFDDLVKKEPKVLAYFTASWCVMLNRYWPLAARQRADSPLRSA